MIFFTIAVLQWIGRNREWKEKIFYNGKYFYRNDESLHCKEEKWAGFLMYKSEIQSCLCQMDMSEKVTVVFFHFMTQSDSYQSQIWPIKIMDMATQ